MKLIFRAGHSPPVDPRITEVKNTLETNQVTKKTFSYDQFNNVTDTYDYDYGDGQPGQVLRRSHTDFTSNPTYTAYTGAPLRHLASQAWVSSDAAGNNKAALIKYEFDNYSAYPLVSRSNVSMHDSANYGVSNTLRGNVTKVTTFTDVQNQTGGISTQGQFDILGNVVKSVDAKGFFTLADFSDRFGSPNGEARANSSPAQLNGQNAFAFVTSATNPLGYISYNQYEYYTSVTVDSEDINENVSTTYYDDPLDRPSQFIDANNRPSLRNQKTMAYDDVNRKVTITSDLYSFWRQLSQRRVLYDSLGRTTETRSYETGGYTVISKPQYDALGQSCSNDQSFSAL